MKNVATPQYSEYRLRDVISRLEGFRNTIGWGELKDDLEVAIDCMQYAVDVIEAEEKATFEGVDFDKLNLEIDDILASNPTERTDVMDE